MPCRRGGRGGCLSSRLSHGKTRHNMYARVCPCSIDKPNGSALSGGPAQFTSPPAVIGVWPSHATTSGDSLCAGCLTILQDYHKCSESNSGTNRLVIGPRESRVRSRVPRHTSSSPAMQATCQGRVGHAPGARLRGSPHPRTSGSTMLSAGHRHCRRAAMPVQERKRYALPH